MQNRKESTCLSPVSSSTTVPKLPFSRKENIPSPCRVQFRGRIYLLRARSDPEVSSTENQGGGEVARRDPVGSHQQWVCP